MTPGPRQEQPVLSILLTKPSEDRVSVSVRLEQPLSHEDTVVACLNVIEELTNFIRMMSSNPPNNYPDGFSQGLLTDFFIQYLLPHIARPLQLDDCQYHTRSVEDADDPCA